MITPEWFRILRWVVIALLVAVIGYFAARAYFSPSSVVEFGNLRMCGAGPAVSMRA